jgi:Ca2+-binding EF-hand superfamily protein
MAETREERQARHFEKKGAATVERWRDEFRRMHLGISKEGRKDTLRFKCENIAGRKPRDDMDINQLYHALQTLGMPLDCVSEGFSVLDQGGKGRISIDFFVGAMLDNAPPLRCESMVARGNAAQTMIDSPQGDNAPRARKAGYPAEDGQSLGQETLFLGSRGQAREDRASHWGRAPNERLQKAPNAKGLNSSVHIHNQQSNPDNVNISDMAVDAFRKSVIRRGGSNGVHAFSRIFRTYDSDSNRRVTLPELKSGLKEFGLIIDNKCLSILVAACDKRGAGSIGFDELHAAVRGPVSRNRRGFIDTVFQKLDKSREGVLTTKDMQAAFNAKHHPDVVSGRISEDQAMANLLAQFDTVDREGVVMVTQQDFQTYYKNVSASFDDDSYFESMMKRAWRLK